jgi:hypothetical protein
MMKYLVTLRPEPPPVVDVTVEADSHEAALHLAEERFPKHLCEDVAAVISEEELGESHVPTARCEGCDAIGWDGAEGFVSDGEYEYCPNCWKVQTEEWDRRVAAGLCGSCEKPREEGGTDTLCAVCWNQGEWM